MPLLPSKFSTMSNNNWRHLQLPLLLTVLHLINQMYIQMGLLPIRPPQSVGLHQLGFGTPAGQKVIGELVRWNRTTHCTHSGLMAWSCFHTLMGCHHHPPELS
eukprot:12408413-Karenia_brevis.AAC.1